MTGPVCVVGAGRSGLRGQGVPHGGAYDANARLLANALVGSSSGSEAAIEIAFGQLVMRSSGPAMLGVIGASVQVEGQGLRWEGSGRVYLPTAGEYIFRLGAKSVRAYIAAEGGFVAQRSSAMSARGKVRSRIGESLHFSYLEPRKSSPIRIVALDGSVEVASAVARQTWEVERQSSRMGIRFTGDVTGQPDLDRSAPSCFGLIQLTPTGMLLIHGPDGPVTGGYARVGYVSECDLPRLAYLGPGDRQKFTLISRRESIEQNASKLQTIQTLAKTLRFSSGA